MAYVGQTFSTGNSVVRDLLAGSLVRVTGPGTLQVEFVAAPPKPVFKTGDRVYVMNRSRYGRIVRMTSVDGLSEQLPEPGEQLYVSDAEPHIVRVAKESNLKKV